MTIVFAVCKKVIESAENYPWDSVLKQFFVNIKLKRNRIDWTSAFEQFDVYEWEKNR